jgi:DUF1707 SHOCT-like domain
VAQELREHFAAGRLTEDELDARVRAAYDAKTEDELRAVREDLPKLPATPQQQRAELVARRSQLQRRVLQEAGGGVALFGLCSVIWAATGASGMFWPIWVALVVVIFVGRNAWRLYGPAPELDRVEEELAARRRRDSRRDRHDYRRDRRDRRRRY